MRAIALLLIPSLMSGAAAPVAAQSAPDPIASVRAFVAQFQRDAPSLVAHEDYVQNATYGTRSGQHQVTTAELVMGPARSTSASTRGWASECRSR